MIYVS